MSDLADPPRVSPATTLEAMGAEGRLAAYQAGELTRGQLVAWAALWPEEVPLVNGELPWIARSLADLD